MDFDSGAAVDLREELLLAAIEEVPLWELGEAAGDAVEPDGTVWTRRRGRAPRSQILVSWLDRGVIDLFTYASWDFGSVSWPRRARRNGDFLVLDRADARELLIHHKGWDLPAPSSAVSLARADSTDSAYVAGAPDYRSFRALFGLPPLDPPPDDGVPRPETLR